MDGSGVGSVSKRDKVLRLIRSLREDPGLKEAAVLREQEIAKTDPEVRDFLTILHMDADREAALDRFIASGVGLDVVDTIRHHFGDRKDIAICEVGAGDGFLAAALVRAGYTNLDILEPAGEYNTGTGFFRTLDDFQHVRAFNDIDAWYADPKTYDLIITWACIHHFDNPAVVASQIRLKVKDKALWLAFSEFFAADYEMTLSQLTEHRHAALYSLYEWPYSARLFTAMIESGGFRRTAISHAIPYGRRPLSPFLRGWRAAWRLLSECRLDALAYSAFVEIIRLFRRDLLIKTGAQYMAFRAKPVKWENVPEGYLRPGTGMLPGWRPMAAPKP